MCACCVVRAVVIGSAVPEGMRLRVEAGRVPECVVVRCVYATVCDCMCSA